MISLISCPNSLHSEIFMFLPPKNVAREFFRCGARSKKNTRHSEKVAVPLFQKTRTAIGAFSVRVFISAGYGHVPARAICAAESRPDQIKTAATYATLRFVYISQRQVLFR